MLRNTLSGIHMLYYVVSPKTDANPMNGTEMLSAGIDMQSTWMLTDVFGNSSL